MKYHPKEHLSNAYPMLDLRNDNVIQLKVSQIIKLMENYSGRIHEIRPKKS